MERRSSGAGVLHKHLSSSAEQVLCNGAGSCGKRARAVEAASAERSAEGMPRPGRTADGSPAGSQALRCERVARSRLSFGDELEEGQDGPGIAASTAKRCASLLAKSLHVQALLHPLHNGAPPCLLSPCMTKVARTEQIRHHVGYTAAGDRFSAEQKAARTTHAHPQASPFSLSTPEGAPQQPSLGRLCFGVAQARGAPD